MSSESDFERELRAREEYEEWSKLPLWEQMRSDIADASAYADNVAALGAKLEAAKQVTEMLRAGVSIIKQGAHLNDDWVRESENALAAAQEEQE